MNWFRTFGGSLFYHTPPDTPIKQNIKENCHSMQHICSILYNQRWGIRYWSKKIKDDLVTKDTFISALNGIIDTGMYNYGDYNSLQYIFACEPMKTEKILPVCIISNIPMSVSLSIYIFMYNTAHLVSMTFWCRGWTWIRCTDAQHSAKREQSGSDGG